MTWKEYLDAEHKRNKIVKEFYRKHEIEGNKYYICGEGEINEPFSEKEKKNIKLFIEDNEHNRAMLAKQFKLGEIESLIELQKTSKLLKEFQNLCVDQEVFVNLHKDY